MIKDVDSFNCRMIMYQFRTNAARTIISLFLFLLFTFMTLNHQEKNARLVTSSLFVSGFVEVVYPACNSYVVNDPTEDAAFLPFGAGLRACVGRKFVILKVATLIASLRELYEVHSNIFPAAFQCVGV